MNRLFAFVACTLVVAVCCPAVADPGGPVIEHAGYTCVVPPGVPCPHTNQEVQIHFDEPVDPVTAADTANYLFYQQDDPDVVIPLAMVGSVWEEDVFILLETLPEEVVHILEVSGVEDLDGNVMEPAQVVIEVNAFPDAVPDVLEPLLLAAAPNPFNPLTQVRFVLPEGFDGVPVTLTVHDARGRAVRRLTVPAHLAAGLHEIPWNGRDDGGRVLASGSYLVRLTAGEQVSVQKVTLAK